MPGLLAQGWGAGLSPAGHRLTVRCVVPVPWEELACGRFQGQPLGAALPPWLPPTLKFSWSKQGQDQHAYAGDTEPPSPTLPPPRHARRAVCRAL